MFESLLESGADKNGVVELHASLPVEHDFIAMALLLLAVQVFCDVVDRDTFGEGCCVSLTAPQRGHLACQTLIMCPMVIRDGMACGFTIRSGTIPSSVNGMSS